MNYLCNQFIVKIDASMKITQVIFNTFNDVVVDIGSSIIHVFSENSLHVFYDNFSTAQQNSSSIGFSAKLINGQDVYVFLINHEIELVVFAIHSNNQTLEMFDEIMVLNNEHVNANRALYKKLSKTEDNMMFFEEIMKVNNSLINLKREISIKNRELERLNRELKEINFIDYLTKIYNRRKFFVDIYELVQTQNYQLTMLDFNHFKAINDEFGHKRGDETLIYFTEMLQRELHDYQGHIYRLGGDEFAFLVSENLSLNRIELFQKIDLELKQFHHLSSVSYGTVLVTKENCNKDHKAELLMAKADKLMYDMKKQYYEKSEHSPTLSNTRFKEKTR